MAQEAALGALNERSLVKKRLLDDEGFPIPDDGSSHCAWIRSSCL